MKRRTILLVLVWTLPSAIFLAATGIVYSAYRIPPPDRLDEAERTQAIASLRAGLEDKPAIPCNVRHDAEGPQGARPQGSGEAGGRQGVVRITASSAGRTPRWSTRPTTAGSVRRTLRHTT